MQAIAMVWIACFLIAGFALFAGRRLYSIDEVLALASYGVGLLSLLWGLAIAPTSAQITVELSLVGGWWMRSKLG